MRDPLQFTEPHPTLPKSNYLMSGRGGAGNYAKYKPANISYGPTATGPAARAPSLVSTKTSSTSPDRQSSTSTGTTSSKGSSTSSTGAGRSVATGRGGAGNRLFRSATDEVALFAFDEELERQQRMLEGQAPVYTVGRGGAGNVVDERRERTESERGSVSSDGSQRSDDRGSDSRVRRSWERLGLGRTFSGRSSS